MDSKSAFHIYKQTLIRRNNVPVSSVYNFDQKDVSFQLIRRNSAKETTESFTRQFTRSPNKFAL